MAARACREWAREAKGRQGPFNIVAAESAHPAFDKVGVRMDIPDKRIPLRDDFRADPEAMAAAIDYDTMMMVLALYSPYGVIEDISMLSPVVEETGVWLRLDACVGGYLTPFVKRLGRELAGFDFEIAGARSISADLHKFGFAPKPSSTVLYRSEGGLSAPNF